MANISQYIAAINAAARGEEVRDSITGALSAINADIPVQVLAALEAAKESGDFDGTGISSITLNSDYTLTINLDDGTSYTTTSIRGETGATGAQGPQGVSPTVTITSITGGHRVTITDEDHPTGQSFDVLDGTIAPENMDEYPVEDSTNAVQSGGLYTEFLYKRDIGGVPDWNEDETSMQGFIKNRTHYEAKQWGSAVMTRTIPVPSTSSQYITYQSMKYYLVSQTAYDMELDTGTYKVAFDYMAAWEGDSVKRESSWGGSYTTTYWLYATSIGIVICTEKTTWQGETTVQYAQRVYARELTSAGRITVKPLTSSSVVKLPVKYLDMDSAPTSGSTKPVTSGGVYTALDSIDTAVTGLTTKVGDLTQLTTTDKSDLVGAINEVDGDIADLNTALSEKADQDGYYPNMTVGTAEQLLSDEAIESQVPYNFKQTPDVGNREYLDAVVGGTVAWNQLLHELASPYWAGNSATVTFSNGIATVNPTAQYGGLISPNEYRQNVIDGHKYFASASMYCTSANVCRMVCNAGTVNAKNLTTANAWTTITFVQAASTTATVRAFGFQSLQTSDFTEFKVAKPIFIDLTAAFGTTIANYIASLGATAGVAWLKSHGFLTKDYYAYNAGSLESVCVSEHRMTGKNFFDVNQLEENDDTRITVNEAGSITFVPKTSDWYKMTSFVIKTTPNTDVTISGKCTSVGGKIEIGSTQIVMTNANQVYSGTATSDSNGNVELKFRIRYESATGLTYANLQIEFGTVATPYEPYRTLSYPLDSDLTLRGIPKLDANNELYYDGDRYLPDGTVQRRYGLVDLGTLDWTYNANYGMFSEGLRQSIKLVASNVKANIFCAKYVTATWDSVFGGGTNSGLIGEHYSGIVGMSTTETDPAAFKAAMSGVYLVYEKATPTTESADPYPNLQVCEAYGTEAFTDAGQRDVEIPAGNETRYAQNLTKKIEGLPWDLSMIAPIENGTTASKAYTAGQYFLKNNQFCKALTSIASGATFTLNTNYAVTTVAAELYTAINS